MWRAMSASLFLSAGGRCSADNAHLVICIYVFFPEVSFALVYGVRCTYAS